MFDARVKKIHHRELVARLELDARVKKKKMQVMRWETPTSHRTQKSRAVRSWRATGKPTIQTDRSPISA